jgi:hypothetical protein
MEERKVRLGLGMGMDPSKKRWSLREDGLVKADFFAQAP